MNLEQLLESKYAEKFSIMIPDYRDDILYIVNPYMISIPINGLKITEHPSFIWLEVGDRYSITLYFESGTTHTAIF